MSSRFWNQFPRQTFALVFLVAGLVLVKFATITDDEMLAGAMMILGIIVALLGALRD